MVAGCLLSSVRFFFGFIPTVGLDAVLKVYRDCRVKPCMPKSINIYYQSIRQNDRIYEKVYYNVLIH